MSSLNDVLRALSEVKFGPTDLHPLIMELKRRSDLLPVRLVYDHTSGEYPWWRSIAITYGRTEFRVYLPRHHDGVPVTTAMVTPAPTYVEAAINVMNVLEELIAAHYQR